MRSHEAASELWLQRQIAYLRDHIVVYAATEGRVRKLNKRRFVNLYSSYPLLLRAMMRLGLLRKRSRKERFSFAFRRMLARHQPDALLINYLNLAYQLRGPLAAYKGNIFIQVHGYDVTWDFYNLDLRRFVYGDDYREFARDLAQRATFIANSRHTVKSLESAGIPPDRIKLRYFGAPPEGPYTRPEKDVLEILYLGRLVDFKGPDLMIRAFERASDLGMRAKLIIAGDGHLRLACELLAARSPYRERIEFLGAVSADEGKELRRRADVFTAHNCKGPLMNQVEAFGVSIVEAMSAGLPVVTGRSGGVVDSVVDGETGFLFEPGDIEAHARCLLRLAEDPALRQRLGEQARRRAQTSFSLEGEEFATKAILGL